MGWGSGLPWWLSSKESACNAGDADSIPGSGRSPGEGNDNQLKYSCLENPVDRGACRATIHGVTESYARELLSTGTGAPLEYEAQRESGIQSICNAKLRRRE